MTKLLLVEDEITVREPLAQQLSKAGFQVKSCGSLKEAEAALEAQVDLMILDWELPDGEGIDLLRKLRMANNPVPVIFLTARADLSDKIIGLEIGADDYMTKPFETKELVARIRTRLRQKSPAAAKKIEIANIVMDLEAYTVTYKGRAVELAKMEFALLKFFMENPGKALARDEILNRVWGFDNFPSSRTVDTHILILRQKLSDELFETLRGIGYRFKAGK